MQRDDRSIQEEGLDALTDEELRSACRSRGMRTPFGEGARAFMTRQLIEWLDLSLNRYKPAMLTQICGDKGETGGGVKGTSSGAVILWSTQEC